MGLARQWGWKEIRSCEWAQLQLQQSELFADSLGDGTLQIRLAGEIGPLPHNLAHFLKQLRGGRDLKAIGDY